MCTRGFIFGRRWREVVQRAFLESLLMPCTRRQIFAKSPILDNENLQIHLESYCAPIRWVRPDFLIFDDPQTQKDARSARPAASPPPGLGSENPRHTSTGHAKVQR